MRRFMNLTGVAVFALLATRANATEPKHDFFTTSDNIKIHYMTLGDKGSWVVLIHGYTGSAEGNWFRNGIAEALAKNHRVVAIDCRNHGKSDKPAPGGSGIARDVIELMDHLKIEKAHIHGYSMGGSITSQLMARIPDRIITAAFGGSGVPETDEALIAKARALDKQGTDPQEAEASRNLRIRNLMDNGKTQAEAEKEVAAQAAAPAPARNAAAPAGGATPQREAGAAGAATGARGGISPAARATGGTPDPRVELDLKKVKFPVIAIVGEFDTPHARTARLEREVPGFKLTILPGKSHLTAIASPYIPKEYGDTLVKFIDSNDKK